MEWWEEPAAADDAEVRRRHEGNRRSWEQAADAYTRRVDETVAFLRAGGSSVHPIERHVLTAHIGPLGDWCEVAVHLQCASGRDTLSLLAEGADRVVGVDIAGTHVDNAARTAAALGAPATFVAADVLAVPRDLDGTADLVYTGRGAIGWLHDLAAWARVIARVLRPGGWLLVFDDHPTSGLFEPYVDAPTWNGASYFSEAVGGRGWDPIFGIDDATLPGDELLPWHGRSWTFTDLVAACRAAGLTIEHLGEWSVDYATDPPPTDGWRDGPVPRSFTLLARRTEP